MRHHTIPCLTLVTLLAGAVLPAATLTGQVISGTGQGLPARVLAVEPTSRASALTYTQPDGKFTLEVPGGRLKVTATHGPEWTIAEAEAAAGERLTLTLTRLVDMPARGYYGTDLHMHSTFSDGAQTPAEVAYACRAEGLQVAALTDHENVAQHESWLAQATADFLPLRGMEITTKLGHILGLNIAEKVSSDTSNGAADMSRIFTQVHGQAGFVVVAHPNAPGMTYQCPDLRDYDALEILNGSIPPYGPLFDFVQGRKAWHTLLSQGLKIAVVGNSDNHDNLGAKIRTLLHDPSKAAQLDKRIGMLAKMVSFEQVLEPWGWKGLHPGFYRTYLQLPERTPEAVQAAVKQGRGFVTNGPLLLATLDGQTPGSELAVGQRDALPLKLETCSNRPLQKLQVVVGGKPMLMVQSNAAVTEMAVPVKRGDWVTVELYGVWPEFATTNAWYVR